MNVHRYHLYLIFQIGIQTNVKDMSYMFSRCSSLSELPDISNWNTTNVKDLSDIFRRCESLSSLPDISN